jgi:hypothetical protein
MYFCDGYARHATVFQNLLYSRYLISAWHIPVYRAGSVSWVSSEELPFQKLFCLFLTSLRVKQSSSYRRITGKIAGFYSFLFFLHNFWTIRFNEALPLVWSSKAAAHFSYPNLTYSFLHPFGPSWFATEIRRVAFYYILANKTSSKVVRRWEGWCTDWVRFFNFPLRRRAVNYTFDWLRFMQQDASYWRVR